MTLDILAAVVVSITVLWIAWEDGYRTGKRKAYEHFLSQLDQIGGTNETTDQSH